MPASILRLSIHLALYELLKANVGQSNGHAKSRGRGCHGAWTDQGFGIVGGLREDTRLANHFRLNAVRAHLLELTGDRETAIEQYRIAANKTGSLPERNYLLTQAARLSSEH